jgi:diguanylate cyclase (GGDEF)-like protein
MTQKNVGAGVPKVDHVCSGKTCMHCRVLNNPDRPKLAGVQPFISDRVLERVRELENRAQPADVDGRVELGSRVDEIEKMALLDGLTELYNSRTFMKELADELKRAKRYKRPLSICIASLDDFRDVQASYGPAAGDLALKVFASLLHMTVRDVDIPARYSGSDLAVIFPETNLASAGVAAERIRQKIINQSIAFNWQSFKVTASFGVAAFPTHGTEPVELIGKAMSGLELARQRGKGYICSP